jgi:hypothetical protein
MIIFQLILVVVLILCVFGGVFYLIEGIRYQRSDRVVYMGSNLAEQAGHVKDIVQRHVAEQGGTQHYLLYEPGAGIATMAIFLASEFKWRKVVALELRSTVYWLGRLRQRLLNRKIKMEWLRRDLFEYQPKSPAVIYCYLTGAILDKLYAQGAFKDSLVICLTFEIKGVQPIEKIPLRSWQKAIRVYDFR